MEFLIREKCVPTERNMGQILLPNCQRRLPPNMERDSQKRTYITFIRFAGSILRFSWTYSINGVSR